MTGDRISQVDWAVLEGTRPRAAGCNARLPAHGQIVHVPIVRLTTADGSSGFGRCRADESLLRPLLGHRLEELFHRDAGAPDAWSRFEFPLWDLAGQGSGLPVFALAATINDRPIPESLRVPCYDTSLYFDDLHCAGIDDAVETMAAEAQAGYAKGHRAFKIKVGRGARHLPLREGTDRDIAIIRGIRRAVGPTCRLMIDANNGYNLNLAKEVLIATRDADVFWIEEPFHEDPVLYRDLKEWLGANGLTTWIADGEGEASSHLVSWAKDGLVDAVQYDIFGYGFTAWLETGRQLDSWGVRSAPHHYGGHYGNYAACHLAAAISGFAFAEWDDAKTPGLITSNYRIEDGFVCVPNVPGFGLGLDEEIFARAVAESGGTIRE